MFALPSACAVRELRRPHAITVSAGWWGGGRGSNRIWTAVNACCTGHRTNGQVSYRNAAAAGMQAKEWQRKGQQRSGGSTGSVIAHTA